MTAPAGRIDLAANNFIGCRFSLHGRDPKIGLDCVGLVLCALEAVGVSTPKLVSYGLRNMQIDHHFAFVTKLGLTEAGGPPRAGDVLLFRMGAAQFHLGIFTIGSALIHAHAGLRRVVETPAPITWKIEKHWRLAEI